MEPPFILRELRGEGLTGTVAYILVVVVIWVQTPPFIFIVEVAVVPSISLGVETVRLPDVNVNISNLKLEEIVSVPEGLFTSIFENTWLADMFAKPSAPAPEKTILAPEVHTPKQFWLVENKFIFPFTFRIPVAAEKLILLVASPFTLRLLHTALPLSTEIVCPACTNTLDVVVGTCPAVAACQETPL